MSGSRWKPLPSSLPEPAREFAERLRALLDDAGLSLRRLAADGEVHYSVTALHRFFSGQAIPPRQLVDVLARRSGVDPGELHELHERARSAVGENGPAAEDTAAIAQPRPFAGRPGRPGGFPAIPRRYRTVGIGAALFAAGLVAGIAVAQSVQEVPDAPAGGVPVGNQLLQNGTFTDTADPWWGSNPDIGLDRQDGQLRATVPGGTVNKWDRIVGYTGVTLTKDRRYSVQFEITGCDKRHVKVTVQHADPPYFKTVEHPVEVDRTMRRITIEFTSSITTPTGKGALNFFLGGHPHDCWFLFDNVSLVEHASPPSQVAAEEPR